MRAVDTNVLVRLIAQDNPAHAATAEEFIAKGAWVSTLVLAEAIWILSTVYELGAKNIAHAIETLLNHQHLTLQDSDAVATSLEMYKAKPSLGFSDCLMLQLAHKAGHLPFGTFDRTLAKFDGAQEL